MTEFESGDPARRYSLVVGGPFHAPLYRLGLTGADQLPTARAAIGLALLEPRLGSRGANVML